MMFGALGPVVLDPILHWTILVPPPLSNKALLFRSSRLGVPPVSRLTKLSWVSHRTGTLSTSTKAMPSMHREISNCTRHSTSLNNPQGTDGTALRQALMCVGIRTLLVA